MAKRRRPNHSDENVDNSAKIGISDIVLRSIDVVHHGIDRLGWPGTLLILAYAFVELHASDEQKREIIDKFILWKDLEPSYGLIIAGLMFVLLFVVQHAYWKRRTEVLERELARLGEWKSDTQQDMIAAKLNHRRLPGGS